MSLKISQVRAQRILTRVFLCTIFFHPEIPPFLYQPLRSILPLRLQRLLAPPPALQTLQRNNRAFTISPVTRSSSRAMADPADLTAAFQNIANVLQNLTAAQAPLPPAIAHIAVLQLFDDSSPFDLSSRAGSSAMAKASSALGSTWDGSINKLPPFLTALKTRAREAKWNAPAPHGILAFLITGVNYNILYEFHSISEQVIETEAFDAGLLLPSNHISAHQLLMNDAILKSNRLHADKDNGPLQWRSTSLEEDVVAMLSKPSTTPRIAVNSRPSAPVTPTTPTPTLTKSTLPPFARHFKSSPAPDAPKFKVGDSQPFNGATWYFCDCPNHRNKIKWHTFPHTECRQRQRWLEETPHPPIATLATTPSDNNSTTSSSNPSTSSSKPIALLLSNALTLAGDKDHAYNLISEALNSIDYA